MAVLAPLIEGILRILSPIVNKNLVVGILKKCKNDQMRKLLTATLLSLCFLFLGTNQAVAQTKTKVKNPSVSASLAKNKLSVATSFSNLSNVKSISYTLTYDSNKGRQGAGGTIKVTSNKNLSRSLLLGTCSGKVCTYHKNVKNIKLLVDFKLKSGGVVSYEKKVK